MLQTGIGFGQQDDHFGVYPDTQNRGGYTLVLIQGGRTERLAHLGSFAGAAKVGDWLDRNIGAQSRSAAALQRMVVSSESMLRELGNENPDVRAWVDATRISEGLAPLWA